MMMALYDCTSKSRANPASPSRGTIPGNERNVMAKPSKGTPSDHRLKENKTGGKKTYAPDAKKTSPPKKKFGR